MPARTSPDETRSAPSAEWPGWSRKINYWSPTLLNGQGKVEKLATGKSRSTKRKKTTEKVKTAKNTLTVGMWNVQTLWATGN